MPGMAKRRSAAMFRRDGSALRYRNTNPRPDIRRRPRRMTLSKRLSLPGAPSAGDAVAPRGGSRERDRSSERKLDNWLTRKGAVVGACRELALIVEGPTGRLKLYICIRCGESAPLQPGHGQRTLHCRDSWHSFRRPDLQPRRPPADSRRLGKRAGCPSPPGESIGPATCFVETAAVDAGLRRLEISVGRRSFLAPTRWPGVHR